MKKKIIAVILAAACLTGCGHKTAYKSLDEEDDTVYTIAILSTPGNSTLEKGFKDALSDTFGDKHVNLVSEKTDDTQLILSENAGTLSQCEIAEDAIPVVSTGVYDIPVITKTPYKDAEDRTTGTNVTGVLPNPPVGDQLSEMIETTPSIKKVGIIYSPENTDAVKENRQLEEYLNEAGIGYREYLLPTKQYKALTPHEKNEVKTSDDIDPTVPQISDEFVSELHPSYSDSKELSWEKKARSSLKNADSSTIIKTAVKQCDAIYISGGFSEKTAADIARVAKNGDTTTFGSDATSGKEALVTLWADPYDSGYKAGEIAYQILVNKEKPGDISVTYQSDSSFKKLYNGSYAEVLGRTFPKSFTEYNNFMKSYVAGTDTEKVSDDD